MRKVYCKGKNFALFDALVQWMGYSRVAECCGVRGSWGSWQVMFPFNSCRMRGVLCAVFHFLCIAASEGGTIALL